MAMSAAGLSLGALAATLPPPRSVVPLSAFDLHNGSAAAAAALMSDPALTRIGHSKTGNWRRSHPQCSSGEAVTTDGNVILFDEDAGGLEEFIGNVKNKLVVLDISTKTCGPCKFIYPKLVKMSNEYPDAVFLKINGDANSSTRALMRKWQIRAVPTFRFFRNGEMVHVHSGAKEDELRGFFLVHYAKVPAL